MRIGYLECFAGIAGDMFLGALCDAGVKCHVLQQAADALQLGVTLEFAQVSRSGIQATKVRVLVNGQEADGGLREDTHQHADSKAAHSHDHFAPKTHSHAHVHGRSLSQIRTLIEGAAIPAQAKAIAISAFEHLGRAEAKIHGVPVESIHFHEIGAVDAIVDIVCGAAGASSLGIDQWFASPVNTGSGFVDCAHGRFPVPAPATAELLAGVPVYVNGPAKELTTPTGAALLLALGCRFEAVPVLITTAIGYGAGTRDPDGFPNVLRLRLGEAQTTKVKGFDFEGTSDAVTVLACAIDDATPEVLGHATQRLLEHGALDVMQQSVVMKKGRQGTLLTVLCAPSSASLFEDLLFRETTTLGVRRREECRTILDRSHVSVATAFGAIRLKVGSRDGTILNAAPEFEDCREAARAHGVSLKNVMQAANAAWHRHTEAPAESVEEATR